MATYGTICEFDDKHSKWSIYKQRLNFYFEANGITDANQKRAIFVSVVGDKTYETLLGLVAPKEPPKVEFDELMKCLDEYYSPTPNKKQYHPPAGAKQVRKPCFRCGDDSHTPEECKFKTYTCSYCKKVGHIVKNCFAKKKKQNNLTVAECEVSSDSPSSNYELYSVINKLSDSAYKTDIIMDQQPISMEIDTGAAVSIMNKSVFEKHYAGKKVPDLVPSQEVLHTYTGETILCWALPTSIFLPRENQFPYH